jgi:hypothetical protein
MPRPLRTLLEEQAQGFLTRHRINEPLQWDPPLKWVDPVDTWPGHDPDRIDHQAFSEVASRGLEVSRMSPQIGMSSEHIRLYMDLTGTTAPSDTDQGQQRSKTIRFPHQGVLEPDRLRELYEDQKLSLQRIAAIAGTSDVVVREAAVLAGITTRPAHRHRSLPITREWLQHQYVDRGRTLADIAKELGTSRPRITQYANEWNIPIRAKGYMPDPLIQAGIRGTLSPELEAAFTGHKAVQRVHRVVQLPGHRSIRAAARALGIGDSIINSQLKAVERAAGFQIINRAIPLSVTARGQAFICNAEQVLRQLNDVLPEGLLKIT